MVDEYSMMIWTQKRYARVQIPLWSMNTSYTVIGCVGQLGSDSSMVDEYLYYVLASAQRKQIPLWSMNTQ